ncbi:MAG TPA: hypothetical protein DCR93_32440 [Cytophagales bacterium]|nr:hypothetical protein [Cytophagales bacterium]
MHTLMSSSTPISPIQLPEAIDWNSKSAAAIEHIVGLDKLFAENPELVGYYNAALAQLCGETLQPLREKVAKYWVPYLPGYKKNTLKEFFYTWLTFTPDPAGPGEYIEYWDYLVNTVGGLQLASHHAFLPWFRQFLNYHGDWINSSSSVSTLAEWKAYGGTPDHPFDISNYIEPHPDGPASGFTSFNQFFLRNLKADERPLCTTADIVAPSDGGIFYLDQGGNADEKKGLRYDLPGKSDDFELLEALPEYGSHFLGGPLYDILLWFTDYHHFHAPVSGIIKKEGLYEGSYNYDFGDFDPATDFAPTRPSGSDRVGWYEKLGKHQRYVWIIETENLGLVAMIAIGFWGVGSIISATKKGQEVKKGEYMGHFGYGGSSIVLAFEPDRNIQLKVSGNDIKDADYPTLIKVRECLQ